MIGKVQYLRRSLMKDARSMSRIFSGITDYMPDLDEKRKEKRKTLLNSYSNIMVEIDCYLEKLAKFNPTDIVEFDPRKQWQDRVYVKVGEGSIQAYREKLVNERIRDNLEKGLRCGELYQG